MTTFGDVLTQGRRVTTGCTRYLSTVASSDTLGTEVRTVRRRATSVAALVGGLLVGDDGRHNNNRSAGTQCRRCVDHRRTLRRRGLRLTGGVSLLTTGQLLIGTFLRRLTGRRNPLATFSPLIFRTAMGCIAIGTSYAIAFLFQSNARAARAVRGKIERCIEQRPGTSDGVPASSAKKRPAWATGDHLLPYIGANQEARPRPYNASRLLRGTSEEES